MMATLRCDHPDIEDLHRRQGRARPAAQLQSVGAGDGRLHGRRASRRAVGPGVRRQGLPHGRRRARCGTASCARPTTTPSPASIFIDRINARNNLAYCEEIRAHQSLRRAAAAAVWRVPAGLDQSGAPWSTSRSPATRRSTRAAGERVTPPPCASSTTPSTSRTIRSSAQRQEAKAKRRIGLGVTGLADALILAGVRYGTPGGRRSWPARGWPTIQSARPISPAPSSPREKGAFPLYRRRALPGQRPNVARAAARTCARRSRRARHPQRLPHLDRAHRHHLAAGRQRVERHRAGVRLPLQRRVLAARRHHARGDRGGLRPRPVPPRSSAPPRRCPTPFVTRRRSRPARASRHAGGAAARTSTAPSPRPSTARRTSPSRPSRTSTSRPTRWASRAAPPTGPTP